MRQCLQVIIEVVLFIVGNIPGMTLRLICDDPLCRLDLILPKRVHLLTNMVTYVQLL